jgi:hypothetical protein
MSLLAIHAPVPIVIGLRFALGLPFRWTLLPLFVAAYFGGQFAGSRWRLHGTAGV